MRYNFKHITRFSDASTFDEICVKCGETDAYGPISGRCDYSHAQALVRTADQVKDQHENR